MSSASTGGCRSITRADASARASPSRATSTRPPALPRGGWSPERRATCSSATPAAPGTCSTSATACSPRPIPTRWRVSSTSCTRRAAVANDVGVLVMAYGTPSSPDDVERYYTHIRRGRPPSPEQLADLRRRYDAIGGLSPLLERTRAQVACVARALGDGHVVALGMKHAAPFVEDGVDELRAAGVARVVGLVLAPHYSALSVGEYAERVRVAAGEMPFAMIESWHLAE